MKGSLCREQQHFPFRPVLLASTGAREERRWMPPATILGATRCVHPRTEHCSAERLRSVWGVLGSVVRPMMCRVMGPTHVPGAHVPHADSSSMLRYGRLQVFMSR